ncbi:MAG: GNAT family N-acetyltransferase, partial [Proteobacteria bacterium]|nr:GNAT family N-acetyltransferase [Pseudomonadota bacterium]
IFLALAAAEVAGFVQLYPSFSSLLLKPLWIVNDLFVSPQYRGQGIAKELLRTVKTFAQKTKARGLTLQTAIDNIPAQRLYESLGWAREEGFDTLNLNTM